MSTVQFPIPPMIFIDHGGCIVGECPICGEWIYESEWKITGEIMHHEDCKVTKYVTQFAKLPISEQKKIMQRIKRGNNHERQ